MNTSARILMLSLLFIFSIQYAFAQCAGDITPPVMNCQTTITVYLNNTGVVTISPSDVDNGSSDNCGIASLTVNGQASLTFNCNNIGANSVTLTATDLNNNTANCTATVTVLDTLSPSPACVNFNANLDNSGTVTVMPSSINAGSTDNCGIDSLLINGQPSLNYTCADLGLHTAFLTVIDLSGNSNTCAAIVSVIDTVSPIAVCNSNISANLSSTLGTVPVSAFNLDNGSSDNCGIASFLINGQARDTFTCADIGVNMATLTVTDLNGNSATCSSFIQIQDVTPPTVICTNITRYLDQNGQVTVFPTEIDGGSSDNCGIATQLINGQPNLTYDCADAGLTHNVSFTAIDLVGNSSMCVASVTILDTFSTACGLQINLQSSAPSSCDSTVCNGAATVVATGGAVPYTYLWNDGNTTASRSGLCPGYYTVITTDNNGDKDTMDVTIGYSQGCVWPGDTDDDATANNFDLLPIALAYGATGLNRPNATLNWQGQAAPDWNIANPVAGLPDYKHIDCDGNSLVDLNDLTAVGQNYGQSYIKSANSPFGTLPFYVMGDTTYEGQRIGIDIILGEPGNIAQDVYAVAFSINYDPMVVEAGSTTVDYSNSWLGTNLISIEQDFHAQGRIETAVGRIDHQNISGYGAIGKFYITIRDDVLRAPASQDMPVTISNVRLIDKDNNVIGTLNPTKIVTVFKTASSVQELANNQELQLFPNPSKGQVNIQLNQGTLQKAQVFSITGQQVREVNLQGQQAQLNLQELASGVYLLAVQTDQGLLHHRIVIDK